MLDTNYQCCTRYGTTQTVVDSGVTADTNFHKFDIIFNDTLATPAIQFFIDGNLVAVITTHLPPAATSMTRLLEPVSTAASNRVLSFAWVHMESDR